MKIYRIKSGDFCSSSLRKKSENVEEKLDDIDVKNEGSKNVVIHGDFIFVAAHYHLSIDNDVDSKNYHSQSAEQII